MNHLDVKHFAGHIRLVAVPHRLNRVDDGGWDKRCVEQLRPIVYDLSCNTGDAGQIHAGRIASVALSADGILMASAGDDAQICLWNIRTGEHLSSFRPQGLYAGMDIEGVTGITEAQKASLRALGAVG